MRVKTPSLAEFEKYTTAYYGWQLLGCGFDSSGQFASSVIRLTPVRATWIRRRCQGFRVLARRKACS